MLASAKRWKGQVSTVQRELAVYARLADELRQPFFRSRAVGVRATLALLDGRFSEAEHLALEALQPQHPEDPLLFSASLAFAYWEQGRHGELDGLVQGAVEQSPFIPGVRAALAHVYAEAGRVDEARAEIERLSSDDLGAMPHTRSGPLLMSELTHAHAILGDTTHAATLYALLLPYARQLVVDADLSGLRLALSRATRPRHGLGRAIEKIRILEVGRPILVGCDDVDTTQTEPDTDRPGHMVIHVEGDRHFRSGPSISGG